MIPPPIIHGITVMLSFSTDIVLAAAPANVAEGIILLIISNMVAGIYFWRSDAEITFSKYLGVMGGLFAILLAFYTLYLMEGGAILF